MNFKQYLIKEGVLTSERDTLIEYLEREGVDIESLDEGFMDKLGAVAKKGIMGAVFALMVAKGAVAGTMSVSLQDTLANGVVKTLQVNKGGADYKVEETIRQINFELDDYLKKNDNLDYKDEIVDKVIEINGPVGKMLEKASDNGSSPVSYSDTETPKDNNQKDFENWPGFYEEIAQKPDTAVKKLKLALRADNLKVDDYDIKVKELDGGYWAAEAVEK